jgi:hypothetical protein
MNIRDNDGLPRSQIGRINRLQMARYQKRKQERNKTIGFVGALLCVWIMLWLTIALLIHNRWTPGTELFTALPANLDDQKPSIEIYGGK